MAWNVEPAQECFHHFQFQTVLPSKEGRCRQYVTKTAKTQSSNLLMAEELVSAILELVRAIKADESVRDFVDVTEFQGEMDSLVLRLEAIRSKMNALKDWPLSVQLSRLEIDGYALDDLLYDIEDMFSDFNNQLMRSRLLVEAVETKVSKEKTDPSDPDIIDLDNDPFESSISKLEVELMDLRSKLSPGPESILLDLEVSKLLGIDQVKKDIMDVILGESSKERSDKIKTISIVGMDGMGKSSLAQCICEDEQVVASFDNIILVNVSDDFDLGKIGRAIIQALEGLKHDFLCILTLFPLQGILDRIYRKIVDKKTLLVLDGVGRYDYDDWGVLKSVFQHGMPESRIVITTCEHKFAVETKSSYIFHLKELPGELCWMILREVAFNGLNEDS
ncbi:putative disease resistance protein RGA3 [Hibiscus syriacus]|nr:putative disease resistance protein RGA3 [Hibiscus syriacus]